MIWGYVMRRCIRAASIVSIISLGLGAALAAPPERAESPRISALAKAVAKGDRSAVDRFWADVRRSGLPLVEPSSDDKTMLATFVADAPRDGMPANAHVMTFQTAEPFMKLEPVPGTNVLAATMRVQRDARAAYLLAWPRGRFTDPSSATAFPKDGTTFDLLPDVGSSHGANGVVAIGAEEPVRRISWFEGDRAPKENFLGRRDVAHGQVKQMAVPSREFGDSRKVSVYTPPGYDPRKPEGYPLLILFDAEQYLSIITAPDILDNMIGEKAITPIVVAFLTSGSTRNADLPPNPRYTAFLRKDLMPWIRTNYAVRHDPGGVAIGGFSYGGLAALNAGLNSSDLFGIILSQSGSFWWAPDLPPIDPKGSMPPAANILSRNYATTARLPLRVFMNVGSWEGDFQVAANRHLRDVLIARGYPLAYNEFEGAHDVIAWRATLPAALSYAFGNSN